MPLPLQQLPGPWPRPRRALWSALSAGAGLLAASLGGPARLDAGGAVTAVSLSYAAPSGCPDRASFVERLAARSRGGSLAFEAAAARRLRVEVVATPAGLEGRLVYREPSGAESSRVVVGPSCSGIVDALALVSAMTLAGAGAERALPVASASGSPPASASARPLVPPEASAPAAPAASPPGEPPLARAWGLGVSVDGIVNGAVAPSPLLGFGGGVELERTGPGRWSPLGRLSLLYLPPNSELAEGHRMRFYWVAARLEGCPLRLGLGGAIELLPCAAVDLGSHMVEIEGRPEQQISRLWLSADLGGRARWSGLYPLVVEASGTALFPFFREDFQFTDLRLHRPHPVAGFGSLGVSFHFL